jgi:hypothetical protein
LVVGDTRLKKRPSPVSVPPEPTPHHRVDLMIHLLPDFRSGAGFCARGLAGLPN